MAFGAQAPGRSISAARRPGRESWTVYFEDGIYQERHIGEPEGGDDDYKMCRAKLATMGK